MTKPKLGRPKGKTLLQREGILKAALDILDDSGAKGLSMRSLAHRLKVTPMALYHHFEDRSSILRGVSDMVYSDVSRKYEGSFGSARQRLEFLLTNYHKAVIRHPNLSLSIFETPEAFSEEASRITHYLMELLKESDLTDSKRKVWLNILVDFTHGSSIATAMNHVLKKADHTFIEKQSAQYAKELRELLDCVFEQ